MLPLSEVKCFGHLKVVFPGLCQKEEGVGGGNEKYAK